MGGCPRSFKRSSPGYPLPISRKARVGRGDRRPTLRTPGGAHLPDARTSPGPVDALRGRGPGESLVCGVTLLWTSLTWGKCAWGLWTQYPPDTTWVVFAAHPTQASCEAEAAIYRDVLRKLEGKAPIPLCLPDAIDPRGKKAK